MTDQETNRLAAFLKHRQFKSKMISVLADISEAKDLKRGDVTTAQNATYEMIVQSVDKAMSKDWLSQETLLGLLDEAEIAGRQHVSLFRVQANKVADLAGKLVRPKNLQRQIPGFEEFWDVPDSPFCRVLRDDPDTVIVKIVSKRTYHTIETLQSTDDYEDFRKSRHKERAAVIVKLDRKNRLIQLRVPPREHGSSDTPRAVYEYTAELLASQYKGELALSTLQMFPITDAFPKLIDDYGGDFVLEYDTPEDAKIKASMARRFSRQGQRQDLRDISAWAFKKGYSRKILRGTWKLTSGDVYVHMNFDVIQLDSVTKQNIARLFFPGRCTDEETDNVIRRIQDHIE